MLLVVSCVAVAVVVPIEAIAAMQQSDLLVSLGHTEVCTRLDKYFAVLNGASKRSRLSDCLHFV